MECKQLIFVQVLLLAGAALAQQPFQQLQQFQLPSQVPPQRTAFQQVPQVQRQQALPSRPTFPTEQVFGSGVETFKQINNLAPQQAAPSTATVRTFADQPAFQQPAPAAPIAQRFAAPLATPLEQHDAQVFTRGPSGASQTIPFNKFNTEPQQQFNQQFQGSQRLQPSTQQAPQQSRQEILRNHMAQEESIRLQQAQAARQVQQAEEQLIQQQQQEESLRLQRTQQDGLRTQQAREEKLRLQQAREERSRVQQTRDEKLRAQQQSHSESIRLQQAREEKLRLQQQAQEESIRLQQAQAAQQQESLRIQQAREEKVRLQQQQQEESIRLQQAQAAQQESLRLQQESLRLQQQQDDDTSFFDAVPVQTTPRPVSRKVNRGRIQAEQADTTQQVTRGRQQFRQPTVQTVQTPIRVVETPVLGTQNPAVLNAEEAEAAEQAMNAHYSFASAIDDKLTDNSQVRQETRDGLNLKGLYSYSDGFFQRTVHYEADQNGYRVVKEEVTPLGDGPQPDPTGSAQVQAQISGTEFGYRITADDIRDKSKDDKVPVARVPVTQQSTSRFGQPEERL